MPVPQNPVPDQEIRSGALVVVDGDPLEPGIVVDDEVDNPIRMVMVGGVEVSKFAFELLPADRATWELLMATTHIDESPS